MKERQLNSSWEDSANWYDSIVGEKGHYYHQAVILPRLLSMMQLKKGNRLLDLGCGQGILSRALPQDVSYLGIDLSPSLIQAAKSKAKANREFLVGDVTEPLPLKEGEFTHAVVLLALQNMEFPLQVFKNAFRLLKPNGHLFLILNHPCFRIPRQSSWGVDLQKNLQYRRIDSYLSPMKIPIKTHPSADSATTFSFHIPLSQLFKDLAQSGFAVIGLEEWCSDKTSEGKEKRRENRARQEFPLFMAIHAAPFASKG